MAEDVDNWEPMTPEQVHGLLRGVSIPWWIAGGWAIDLFLGRQTRTHGDTDVLICRDDQLAVQNLLSDWDLHKTQQPGLKSWPEGEFLNRGANDTGIVRLILSQWRRNGSFHVLRNVFQALTSGSLFSRN